MTDLHVAQPVFTLVLDPVFRLQATTLPAIVERGAGTFTGTMRTNELDSVRVQHVDKFKYMRLQE